MNQAQIQYLEGGIDIQLGCSVQSNFAEQDNGEQYVSFGEGNEQLFGEGTADLAENLKESA